jgi:Flp pilus assembly protein TadG
MTHTRNRQNGSATLEMTLVGIPLIFVLISTVEVARGMWIYHTLAYALREGTRYTIVHGVDCSTPPNTCAVKVKDIAKVIQSAGVGLYDTDNFHIEMTSLTDDVSCSLTSALASTAPFPSSGGDAIGAPITLSATYPFQSAIAMFWPGAGPGINFMSVTFPASSQENIQF